MLWLQTNKVGSGTMNLGGSLTRQVRCHLYVDVIYMLDGRVTEHIIVFGPFQTEQDAPVSESSPHIANIGRMVEDMENKIR